MLKKKDVWLWCHPAGSFTGSCWGKTLDGSTIEAGAAARRLGISQGIMVRSAGRPATAEFEHYMAEMKNLDAVKWSIIGDSASPNEPLQDLAKVLEMKKQYPNINGVMLDDFFPPPWEKSAAPRMTPEQLAHIHDDILKPNQMDMWAVYYEHQLDFDLTPYARHIDAINFWTWYGQNIDRQAENVKYLHTLAHVRKVVLGLYMWDFGNCCPLTPAQMDTQFDNAEKLHDAGLIDAVILLASCLCDRDIEAVDLSRRRIAAMA